VRKSKTSVVQKKMKITVGMNLVLSATAPRIIVGVIAAKRQYQMLTRSDGIFGFPG
jgi:hypothetical protein